MPEKKSPLQRRIAPSVPVVLEFPDEPKQIAFRLSFDMNTTVRIEEKTGLNMLGVTALWTNLSTKALRAAFWAAMIPNHPEYDSDEGLAAIGSLLVGENGDRAADAVWKAYLLFLPESQAKFLEQARKDRLKELESGNPPKPATPTQTTDLTAPAEQKDPIGSSSGPSPALTSASAIASSAS